MMGCNRSANNRDSRRRRMTSPCFDRVIRFRFRLKTSIMILPGSKLQISPVCDDSARFSNVLWFWGVFWRNFCFMSAAVFRGCG